MKIIGLKNIVKKASLFLVALLTVGIVSVKAQNYPNQTRPDSTTRINPNAPGRDMSTPEQKQKPDTGSHWKGHMKSKLTQAQIDKIVGNDTKVSVDAMGRQLYKETATGKEYYINDSGTKVYVK